MSILINCKKFFLNFIIKWHLIIQGEKLMQRILCLSLKFIKFVISQSFKEIKKQLFKFNTENFF